MIQNNNKIDSPLGEGAYMLRKPFVLVFIRLRVRRAS
jgi:hypothetical protein